ncbi:TIGR00255 family protein [Ohtaekwangia koreensis]|uniref:TIGR00255 family protein n=2 Tax=Ohtaekwangia koreensis TaxID=688867 RepID=A0A1T5II78_9BACT|nr:TIGR00255 family protein [Ohtaekwangia koreensis]
MTGFGQSAYDDGRLQINVEIKSLNSKFLDLNLRLPKTFADREIEIRNLISEKLERGKVSIAIEYQRYGDASMKQSYNETLFMSYYQELKKLADRVIAPHDNLFQLALNSPDVIQSNIKEESNDDEWEKIKSALLDAIQKCEQFRKAEGSVLEKMLKECGQVIAQELKKVEELDPKRVQRIRDRLKGNIVSFFGEEGFDTNRLEQEIIFYIEKLDINEEKVRLKSHLDYFTQIISEKQSNGKKLGFISQEIGREINTIGSKANDADIQKHVVIMKEELEKIKEQLNNVL